MHGTLRTMTGAAAAALLLHAGAAAAAQPKTRPAPAPPAKTAQQQPGQGVAQMPADFRQKLDEMHSRNIGAIDAAKIAEKSAQTPEVKALAQKIAGDRTNIDQQLRQVAQAHGHQLAEPGQAEKQASMDVQSKMQQGGDLDRQYVQVASRDLEHDEQLLKDLRDAVPGQDAHMKQWLDTSENAVEAELEQARQAKQTLDQKGR